MQAAGEVTYQILISALTGADLVHDLGALYCVVSPEFHVFENEIIDMAKVLIGGIEINDESLAVDIIERLGPRANYLSEKHTLKHFRKFWVPKIFDRSSREKGNIEHCGELLNKKTIEILRTHKPKPLSEGLFREIKNMERIWLDRVGLKEYPKREEIK